MKKILATIGIVGSVLLAGTIISQPSCAQDVVSQKIVATLKVDMDKFHAEAGDVGGAVCDVTGHARGGTSIDAAPPDGVGRTLTVTISSIEDIQGTTTVQFLNPKGEVDKVFDNQKFPANVDSSFQVDIPDDATEVVTTLTRDNWSQLFK